MNSVIRRSLLRFVPLWICLFWVPLAGGAEPSNPIEDKVKAACVYNFALNAVWPETSFTDADAAFVIGFVGEVSFRPLLERGLRDKKRKGRAIAVRSIHTPEEATQCHLVFISETIDSERTAVLIERLAHEPVMTVGDRTGFAEDGGILNFTKIDGRVRFEVNREAVSRSGIKLGSQLLKLALVVSDRPRRPGI